MKPSPRVLFVGNSHAACIKHAAQENPSVLAIPPEFFWNVGTSMSKVAVQDGCLVGMDDLTNERLSRLNNKSSVDLRIFTHIVVVGLNVSHRLCLPLFSQYRVFSGRADRRVLISRSAATAALAARMDISLGFKLARAIRDATGSSIIMMPQPAQSELLLRSPEPRFRSSMRTRVMRSWAPYADPREAETSRLIFSSALLLAADKNGLDAIPQPYSTMSGAFTLAKYQRNVEFKDDITHTNTAYGRLMLEAVADKVEKNINALSSTRDFPAGMIASQDKPVGLRAQG